MYLTLPHVARAQSINQRKAWGNNLYSTFSKLKSSPLPIVNLALHIRAGKYDTEYALQAVKTLQKNFKYINRWGWLVQFIKYHDLMLRHKHKATSEYILWKLYTGSSYMFLFLEFCTSNRTIIRSLSCLSVFLTQPIFSESINKKVEIRYYV